MSSRILLLVLAAFLAAAPAASAGSKSMDLGPAGNEEWRKAMRVDKSPSRPGAAARAANATKPSSSASPVERERVIPRSLQADEDEKRLKPKPQVGVSVAF